MSVKWDKVLNDINCTTIVCELQLLALSTDNTDYETFRNVKLMENGSIWSGVKVEYPVFLMQRVSKHK